MKLIFSYFFVIALVSSQHISDGPCPNRAFQQDFDVKKYASGVWYEILRYEAPFTTGCNCNFANYNSNEDNSVDFNACCKHLPNTTSSCVQFNATLSEPDHVPLEGKLNVASGKGPNWRYSILSTDFDNYAITYGCINVDDNKSHDFAWLLSREPQLNPSVKSMVDGIIDVNFDRSKMYQVDQSAERCERLDE